MASHDYQLIDPDPLPTWWTALRSSVHGGEQLTADDLTAAWEAVGLTAPIQVLAVQRAPAGRPPRGWRVLDLHPGLRYLLAKHHCRISSVDRWLHSSGGERGEPQPCTSAALLIRAIQQAIIALRRREFAGATDSSTSLSKLEQQAREELCTGSATWRLSLAAWLDSLFAHYHHIAINLIRRRLIEFATDCTRRYPDRLGEVNHLLTALMGSCTQVYVLGDLRRRAEEDLLALGTSLQAVVLDVEAATCCSDLVQRAWHRIRRDCTTPLSLDDLATSLGCSAGHLSRQFRRETGRTVLAAITGLRLAKARELLADSDDGILTIALASGFPSVEHFHRVFKRQHHCTPREWRIRVGRTREGLPL